MSLDNPWIPVELTAVEKAFPAHVAHLMPQQQHIADSYRLESNVTPNEWAQFASQWFAGKLPSDMGILPKEKINVRVAYEHLNAILRSYEPKHEHKLSAVAFLASKWFDAIVDNQANVIYGEVPKHLQEKAAE